MTERTCERCDQRLEENEILCKKCRHENPIRLPEGIRLGRWPARKGYQRIITLVTILVIVWSVIVSTPQSRAFLTRTTDVGGHVTPTIPPTESPIPVIASAATVTITPKSQQVRNTFNILGVTGTPGEQQVQARMLSATTRTFLQVANATGNGMTPGTQARGTVFLGNSLHSPITILAGSVYPCNVNFASYCSGQTASIHIVVDQTVTLGDEQNATGIPAHVQEIGTIGNFNHTPNSCCFLYNASALGILNDSAFTGGTDPQPFTFVQQGDIDNAASSLISANQPNAQQVLQGQIQANERAIGTPQCAPKTSADQQAGDHVTTVTVSVNFTCTGEEVYDYNGVLALAGQLLRNQAADNPGSSYALVGHIIATLNNASLNGQTVALTVTAKGVWVYQMSAVQQQSWASSITGQTPRAAQARLSRQQGIAQVAIQPAEADAQVLPTDARKITVVVQPIQGL